MSKEVTFWRPNTSTIFYGNNRKIIIVFRDPKSNLFKHEKETLLVILEMTLKFLLNGIKALCRKVDKNEHNKIIKIKFENFLKTLRLSQKKLCKFRN